MVRLESTDLLSPSSKRYQFQGAYYSHRTDIHFPGSPSPPTHITFQETPMPRRTDRHFPGR